MPSKKEISDKARRFAARVIETGNQTRAYIETYPGDALVTTSAMNASRLVRTPKVARELRRIRDECRERNALTIDEMVESARGTIAAIQASILRPARDAEGEPIYRRDDAGEPLHDATGALVPVFHEHLTAEMARELRSNNELLAKLGGFLDKSRAAVALEGANITLNLDYQGSTPRQVEGEVVQGSLGGGTAPPESRISPCDNPLYPLPHTTAQNQGPNEDPPKEEPKKFFVSTETQKRSTIEVPETD